MKIPPKLIGWPIAAVVLLLRWTCRVRVTNDPRPALRKQGQPYIYSILHAHQIAAAINTERDTAAMVSQSGDGELIVPAFNVLGIKMVRGSSRTAGRDRGGADAIAGLTEHVAGGESGIIAVDGPRGPRSRVRKGIATVAVKANAAVLNVVLVPRRRIVARGAWDRFQFPIPFTCIHATFAEPILPGPGESVESVRRRVEESLRALETRCDPDQADPLPAQDSQDAAHKRAA